MNIFYVDGDFVAEDQAVVPVTDMGLLRGYGVFDFMRTYGRRPFYLEDHVRRLENSARLIGLPVPRTRGEIMDITLETIARNGLADANVRIVVTGGVSPDGITPGGSGALLVLVTPLHPCPLEWYRDGAGAVTAHDERYIPGAKTTNYIPAILAMRRARRLNAVESVYVDRYGRLLEGTTSNFFAVIDGRLTTPGVAILPGITRQVVLTLARDEYDVEIRDIHIDEMRLMDEIFLTASNKEIVPVVRIDGLAVGDGTPGPATRRIMALFAAHTRAYGEGKTP